MSKILIIDDEAQFTIAVSKTFYKDYFALRATLAPAKIYEIMTKAERSGDVYISMVSNKGTFQLVHPDIRKILGNSGFIPPLNNNIGIEEKNNNEEMEEYAYAWLKEADWAIVVEKSESEEGQIFGFKRNVAAISIVITLIVFGTIVVRSRQIVQTEKEKDIVSGQLIQASKLASVGELASGIAHEINNPLAIISSEAGLIKDLMNPAYVKEVNNEEFIPRLDRIEAAVFRCRDITRKLLTFVRQSDVTLKMHDINEQVNDLVEGFFEHKFEVSNIKLVKKLEPGLPEILTDSNQLRQVLLNIINNAADAIKPPGTITVETSHHGDKISIAITDTGKGILPEHLEKIFQPFFTTKDVGKGTGLGLSLSYNIIKSFGGDILVDSIPGRGSTFKIILPVGKIKNKSVNKEKEQ